MNLQYGLIGISNNITANFTKIFAWAKSFEKHVPNGRAVLLAVDLTLEDKQNLNLHGIAFHEVEVKKGLTVNDSRLKATVDYLKQSNFDRLMVTDVFDVVFQANPFLKPDWNNYSFFVGGEGILHSEEPWNMDVLRKAFPTYANTMRDHQVVCSGVLCGTRSELIRIIDRMRDLVDNAELGHDIRDQAALNIMIAQGEIPKGFTFKVSDGWVVHAAVSGPTFQHENWGFKQLLEKRYGLPKLGEDSILTHNDQKYDIVHQFNRIDEWNSVVMKDYA